MTRIQKAGFDHRATIVSATVIWPVRYSKSERPTSPGSAAVPAASFCPWLVGRRRSLVRGEGELFGASRKVRMSTTAYQTPIVPNQRNEFRHELCCAM